MKVTIPAALVVSLLLAGGATGQTPDASSDAAAPVVPAVSPPEPVIRPATAAQIVETERAFAADAAEIGNVPAFRKYAAPGLIMFLPRPIEATDYLAKADWPGTIKWRPALVALAQAGDLALATGPSLWTVKGESDPGYYLTIWARQPDGEWKFALDRGLPGTPDLYTASARPSEVLTLDAKGDPLASPEGLEAVLADGLSRDAGGTILSRLDPKGRVMRAGAAPAIGLDDARVLLTRDPASVRTRYIGGAMSKSGDLAYSFGQSQWSVDGKAHEGAFVRVWIRHGKTWSILIDHQVALPPA